MRDQVKSRLFKVLRSLGISRLFSLNVLPDNRHRAYLGEQGPVGGLISGYFKTLARYTRIDSELQRLVTYSEVGNKVKLLLNVCEYTQCQNYFYIPNSCLKKMILRGGEAFIDVGANVGVFSLMAVHHFSHVLSFEPMPETCSLLLKNRDLSFSGDKSTLKDKMKVFPIAISNENRDDHIFSNPLNLGGSKLGEFSDGYKKDFPQFSNWKSHEVICRPLDEMVVENDIDAISLIKIDVEGFEVDVIKGAVASIEKFEPVLYVEVSSESSYRQIMSILPEGYSPWDPASMEKVTGWIEPDMVFAKKNPFSGLGS